MQRKPGAAIDTQRAGRAEDIITHLHIILRQGDGGENARGKVYFAGMNFFSHGREFSSDTYIFRCPIDRF